MSRNSVLDFAASFSILSTLPPSLSDLIPIDTTSYLTAKQIFIETQHNLEDQESHILNQKAMKLLRLLEEGKSRGFITREYQQIDQWDIQAPARSRAKSPIKLNICFNEYSQEESVQRVEEKKPEAISLQKRKSLQRTTLPKREQYIPSAQLLKDQNLNYGNRQGPMANNVQKRIVELNRKEYRMDQHVYLVPNPEPAPSIKQFESRAPKTGHRKANSALPLTQKIVLSRKDQHRRAMPRVERPKGNYYAVEEKLDNSLEGNWEDRDRDTHEKQFLNKLKQEFSAIYCNQLIDEEKKVSEELKLLEIRLGEIVGNQTPHRYPGGPRVSPCHSGVTQAGGFPLAKTVRVNLTPTRNKGRGGSQTRKSPLRGKPELLSRRVERLMRG